MKKNNLAIIILSAVVVIQAIIIVLILIPHPKKKIIKPAHKAPVVKARIVSAKIAIVLDDWGYNLNNLAVLKTIKYPLTLAVLPNLSFSKRISQEARDLGLEVILHLPSEPMEKVRLENNTILTTMSDSQIRKIVNLDLDNILYAKGVSNHMGSKATQDQKTMAIIFSELKKRNLYFLDSFVSGGTVCFDVTASMGVKFARRDIFLDNNDDSLYIKGQINKLKAKAKEYGSAIGIGHDRKTTLQVLKEALPELEKEGYKLVFLSELVK